MKRIITILVINLLLMTSCVTYPYYKNVFDTPVITGSVYDNNEKPIVGALVSFEDAADVYTDEKGFFRIPASSRYTKWVLIAMDPPNPRNKVIMVQKEGYDSYQKEIVCYPNLRKAMDYSIDRIILKEIIISK